MSSLLLRAARAIQPLLAALLLLVLLPAGASAAGTPNISLAADVPAAVLHQKDYDVNLTATNPAGQPTGYNLTFRDVLPVDVSYVAGSATYGGVSLTPRILANAPSAGQTTLLFENVADLSPSSSGTLSYKVHYVPASFTIGSTIAHQPGAFINSDARYIPKFNANGTPNPTPPATLATSFTGYDTTTKTATVTAIDVTQSEPSPEGELLRGAHDHQTVYAFTVENNTVKQTTGATADVYLPAGLEFLGCGDVDWTTSAPTNPGSAEEWDGSGALGGHTAAPPGCDTPSAVATVSTDPDGTGPLPTAVYTKVSYPIGTLAVGATKTIRYVAAIPIRANTLTWSSTTPSAAGLHQAANLDNNSGAETSDEQSLPTYTKASGNYNGVTAVSDADSLTRTGEDLMVLKTVNSGQLFQGQLSRWTLTVKTGEYRYVDDVRVTDTVPDGLCPLASPALDPAADCAFTAGNAPSSPYTGATENADGSWTLSWNSTTDAALARMQPSSTHAISFSTRSRASYQENGADEKPVLARDTWTNGVSIAGADFTRCSNVADCGPLGVEIAHDEVDGVDDLDVSSAAQSAAGPTIDKSVRVAGGAVPADCSGGSYTDGPEGPYGPGDRVCYKLRVDFNSNLDTGSPTVTDFLPAGVTYESHVATASNTVAVASFSGVAGSGVVSWTLGNGTGTADKGDVFEVLVAGRVTDPAAGQSADIKGNLMKFAHANSAGQSFPLRDQADFTWTEAQLTLTEGVRDINDAPVGGNGPNVDTGTVQAGDVVTIRVDVANGGGRAAANAVVWERLPSSPAVACAAVSNVSAGGTCSAGVVSWSLASLAAGATTTLTYDYVVPSGSRPGTTFAHRAGVRSYESSDNASGVFAYYPASNIDPAVVSGGLVNTGAADDPTSVATASPATSYTSTSDDISQSGNASGTANATVGERISYTATATIPQGTTLQDTAGPATFTIPVGAKQTYLAGTAAFTLNGSALPGGFTTSVSGNTITVTFPADYVNAAGSGADVLAVTYQATVDNIAANKRTAGQTITTTATLRYANGAGVAQTPNTSTTQTIVEPNLTVVKGNNAVGGRVSPGQIVRYTLTLTNPSGTRISAANDVAVVDTVPSGMTPVDALGAAVPDGGSVQPSAGTWDASARTITFTQAVAAVGGSSTFSYDLEVDDPQIGNAAKTNSVVATATSYPSASTLYGTERDATTATAQSAAGYRATATNTVKLGGASLTKAVDAATATIGEQRTFTLDVTIPGGLDLFDVTARDLLPDGLDYEPGSFDVICLGGCGLTATAIAPTANPDGSTQLGFFIGDITSAAGARVVRITYTAHVDDRYEPEATPVARPNALQNTAAVHSNQSDAISGTPASVPDVTAYSDAGADQHATVTVVEPALTIDKDVSGQTGDSDVRNAQPGDTFTYTVAVTNSGNTPAHDVVIADQPDAELVDVAVAAGQSTTDLTDGWSAADPDVRWTVASIAAGQTITLTYSADLDGSANLHEADQGLNTADIPAYFARAEAERSANGFDYRAYGTGAYDVTADTVTVNVDLPRIEVDLTTGAPASPESADAEVGQTFPWRAVVRNTSPSADARNADLTVRLPANWTYATGSQSGGGAEPAITLDAVNGDQLTWSDFVDLAPGASRVVTFDTTPVVAAKTDPGTGAANPNIARATVTTDDISGAAASADAAYADGPDPAQAILLKPDLAITKTPDAGDVTAGTTGTWTITVDNNGTGTARGVHITDTIPAGVTYSAGSATSAGPLSEDANTLDGDGSRTVVWSLADLAAGGSATVTVPVAVAAGDDAGTTYTNAASVAADEQPDGPTDTGSLNVVTSADLGVAKSASPAAQNAGETVDFTMVVTNDGPSEARDSTLTDDLPAGLTFVSFLQGDADCEESAGVISCDFGTLAPSATRTVEVRARIAADQTGTLSNTATVGTSTTDPVAVNDSDDAQVTVTEQADLKVTKSTDASPVLQTENASFTVLVENLGPSDARDVALTDVLPPGMTMVSMSGAGATCDTATAACDLATIAANGDATVTVVARADTAGTKTNVASATTSADDPVAANDWDDAQLTVDPAVDLEQTKTVDAATVVAGETAVFTLTTTNHGPSDAHGVTVTDTLPAGTSYVSDDADCTEADGVVTCGLGTLAVDDSATVHVTLRAAHASAEQTLTNSATASSTETDLAADDNTATAQVTVGPSADLAVEKTVSPTGIPQNRDASYTLTVTNHGPSTATDITLSDTLPAGFVLVSATQTSGPAASCTTPAAGSGGTVTCTLASLAVDGSVVMTVTVNARAGVGDHTNTATVTGAEPDADPDNNTASAPISVGPTSDLSVTKAGPATVTPGGELTYVITARNAGPTAATGVTVVDTLPTGMTYLAADASQGTCSHAAGVLTCALGELPTSGDATVTLTAKAGFSLAGQSAVNTVTVTGDQNDNDPSDDSATHTVTVGPAADLQLTKTAPEHVPAGGRLLYTISVANAGPQAATGVTVTDTLPDGLALASAQSSQGTCSADGQKVTCLLGDIASGGGAQVLVAADVSLALEGGTLRNTAAVAGEQPDSNLGNNADDAGTAVGPELPVGSLTVDKVADASVGELGGSVGFTITVRNASNKTATGVTAVDQPSGPAGIGSVVSSQGTCDGLRCDLGTLAPGAHATIRVVMTPRQAGTFENHVAAISDQGDRQAANNVHVASVHVTSRRTAFKLSKRAAHRTARAGTTMRYTITAKNTGGHAAANVRVCDAPGSQLTFVRARGARFSKGRACWTIGYWRAGQSRRFHVKARLAGDAHGKVVNRGTLTADNTAAARARAIVRAGATGGRGGGVTG